MEEFMYSTWFGNDIYVSPKGNVYCMYHFDDIKYLIMDMDMTIKELKNVEDFDRVTSEVLVYWMYGDDYLEDRFKQSVKGIVAEYEKIQMNFLRSTTLKVEIRRINYGRYKNKWNYF